MALFFLENFEWYRRGVAFPPLSLPSSEEDLCPDFDLAIVEMATQDFSLPKMPQVVFLAMLLNDAIKLGVPCRWILAEWSRPSNSYGGAPSKYGWGVT